MSEPDYDDIHPPVMGNCDNCGEVEIVQRDHGIGRYEFWGSKGVHRDMRDCCGKCGDEL
ncbi:MAG: hypothetical protein CPSOU_1845 [uncultured Paraburkholderia sp.]|nr:MAG: hypothetical protein CPSOU_1845 [uncultured Paraburkholderia sp.]